MKEEKNIPMLFVDNSLESKKAKNRLAQSKKEFEVWEMKKPDTTNIRPPVLFAPEGVFRGYKAIDAYATSTFGQTMDRITHQTKNE